MRPSTSQISPHRWSPGQTRDSIVSSRSSLSGTPPAVTSAYVEAAGPRHRQAQVADRLDEPPALLPGRAAARRHRRPPRRRAPARGARAGRSPSRRPERCASRRPQPGVEFLGRRRRGASASISSVSASSDERLHVETADVEGRRSREAEVRAEDRSGERDAALPPRGERTVERRRRRRFRRGSGRSEPSARSERHERGEDGA